MRPRGKPLGDKEVKNLVGESRCRPIINERPQLAGRKARLLDEFAPTAGSGRFCAVKLARGNLQSDLANRMAVLADQDHGLGIKKWDNPDSPGMIDIFAKSPAPIGKPYLIDAKIDRPSPVDGIFTDQSLNETPVLE